MATITLTGGTFGCTMGMGVFEGIGVAFNSAKSSSYGLSEALLTLSSKINLAAVAAKVETSQEQVKKAKERESTKKSSLSLAYEKLNTLISDISSVDRKASIKIIERKDLFYDRYNYLKPNCEKTIKEKYNDWKASVWDGLCSIGNTIKNFALDVVEWAKEHWLELLVGLVVIVIGAVITVLTGGTATGFWAAFGMALLKGLASAALTAVISGTINAGCTYYQYRKAGFSHTTAMENAKNKFGDGAASGFMAGGISFGISSTIEGLIVKVTGKSISTFLAGNSFWGSAGKSAMYESTTNSIASMTTSAIDYYIDNGTLKGSGEKIARDTIYSAISSGLFGGIKGGVSWNNTMPYKNYKKTTIEQLKLQMKNNISGVDVKNGCVGNAYKDITAFSNSLKPKPIKIGSFTVPFTVDEIMENIITDIFDGIYDAISG